MEVYTPVPDEAVRRSTRRGWVVGPVVLLLAVVLAVAVASRFTPQPDFRNFGTVETRFGAAGVVCGGEVTSGCNQTTGLAFAQCTPALADYFYSNDSQTVDARVRELLGARPPAGNQWLFTCGRQALIRGGPAHLEPS